LQQSSPADPARPSAGMSHAYQLGRKQLGKPPPESPGLTLLATTSNVGRGLPIRRIKARGPRACRHANPRDATDGSDPYRGGRVQATNVYFACASPRSSSAMR
jgi:hypothetical protein